MIVGRLTRVYFMDCYVFLRFQISVGPNVQNPHINKNQKKGKSGVLIVCD